MGFGHRVYKTFDPRANILRKKANVVLEKLGIDDPLLDIAVRLEETALKDDYFIERKLFPNVDFYSGIIYRALGIPTDMMTVMFAMGRLSGWIAHWLEMHDQHQPIGEASGRSTPAPTCDNSSPSISVRNLHHVIARRRIRGLGLGGNSFG